MKQQAKVTPLPVEQVARLNVISALVAQMERDAKARVERIFAGKRAS
jgi:hypothetical protein